MTTTIPFIKVDAAGNDFAVIDTRGRKPLQRLKWREISRVLCDRHHGIGADGLLVLEPSRKGQARMRIFNADGSEAEMCGNGARCVAMYLSQTDGKRTQPTIETLAGILTAKVSRSRVAMRMTDPTGLRLNIRISTSEGGDITVHSLNTGVPHLLVPVPYLEAVEVAKLGRALRRHPAFAPNGTNVNFVERGSAAGVHLRIRTYERGVEGETLACGTGITASAILAVLSGFVTGTQTSKGGKDAAESHRVGVETASGDRLAVSFRLTGSGPSLRIAEVIMEGPARKVYAGTVTWPLERR